jgi:hypothetical protein
MGPTRIPVAVRAAVLLVALASACARQSEFIGNVAGQSGQSGRGGQGGQGNAPGGNGGAPGATCDFTVPAVPVVSEPTWACGRNCIEESGAAPRTAFEAATPDDPGRVPEWAYPLPGSVHPINLPRLLLQWRRASGPGQTAFRITIEGRDRPGPPFEFLVPYTPPTQPTAPLATDVVYDVRPEHWKYIAAQLAGSEATLRVAALDPTANKVTTSAAVTIRFTAAPVEARVHYVTLLEGTPPDQRGLRRLTLGADTSELLVRPGSAANGHDCTGCHSPSADGARVAFAAGYGATLGVADTGSLDVPVLRPSPDDTGEAVAPALSPRGDRVFARDATNSTVTLRTADGIVLHTRTRADMEGRIDYPAWSPSGTELVAGRAVSPSQPAEPYLIGDGHIVTIPITGDRIGDPELLVADTTGAWVYMQPVFSPDGAWVVFVARRNGAGSRSANSELRLFQRSTGRLIVLGATTRELEAKAISWPHFAPVPQNGCRKLYLVFQSHLDYGFVLRNILLSANAQVPQLWLSEIDVDKLDGDPSGDPMSAPVWLPGQDSTNKNILPFPTR